MRLLLLVFLMSCASTPLTKEEKSVRVLRKSDAPSTCKEINRVTSPGYVAFTEQGLEDNLRREAFKAGGDTVQITHQDYQTMTMYGVAYKCR